MNNFSKILEISLLDLKTRQSASPRDRRKKPEVSRTFRSATKQLGTFFLLNGSQNFNFFILNILNDLDIDSYRFRPCESNATIGFTISSILSELERVKKLQACQKEDKYNFLLLKAENSAKIKMLYIKSMLLDEIFPKMIKFLLQDPQVFSY